MADANCQMRPQATHIPRPFTLLAFAPHRKKPPSLKHDEVARLTPEMFEKLKALVAISRMAIALERRNTGGSVAQVASSVFIQVYVVRRGRNMMSRRRLL